MHSCAHGSPRSLALLQPPCFDCSGSPFNNSKPGLSRRTTERPDQPCSPAQQRPVAAAGHPQGTVCAAAGNMLKNDAVKTPTLYGLAQDPPLPSVALQSTLTANSSMPPRQPWPGAQNGHRQHLLGLQGNSLLAAAVTMYSDQILCSGTFVRLQEREHTVELSLQLQVGLLQGTTQQPAYLGTQQ
eukprot:jgi/Ulvmu1/3168/UM015_0209.1